MRKQRGRYSEDLCSSGFLAESESRCPNIVRSSFPIMRFDVMLLAATEAYCLGVPQKARLGRRKGDVSVEVDGYLLGI